MKTYYVNYFYTFVCFAYWDLLHLDKLILQSLLKST